MSKKFFYGAMCGLAAIAMMFSSCKETNANGDTEPVDPSTPTLTLDKGSMEVMVGSTGTITATISPADANAVVEFASSDEAVATVTGDKQTATVTGVKAGTVVITAKWNGLQKSCTVIVSQPAGELHESLKGSNYHVIQLDSESQAALGDKIVANLSVNNETNWMYVWEDTYIANTPSGKNCYGSTQEWPSLTVGSVGWSGLGYSIGHGDTKVGSEQFDALAEVYNNASDYYFHIALKGKQGVPYLFKFEGTSGEAVIVFGPRAFEDNGNSFEPFANYTNDGEWNHFDVPVTEFTKQGWMVTTGNTTNHNVVVVLAGGTPGTNVDFDAMFFYKKAQ